VALLPRCWLLFLENYRSFRLLLLPGQHYPQSNLRSSFFPNPHFAFGFLYLFFFRWSVPGRTGLLLVLFLKEYLGSFPSGVQILPPHPGPVRQAMSLEEVQFVLGLLGVPLSGVGPWKFSPPPPPSVEISCILFPPIFYSIPDAPLLAGRT